MVWETFKSIKIKAPPSKLFQVLSDVPNWPQWDVDLKRVEILQRPLPDSLEGTNGNLYMNFSPNKPIQFKLQNIKQDEHVEYLTKLPGSDIVWYWKLGAIENGTELKMGLVASGWLTFGYKMFLGKDVDKAFDICTLNLKNICESP